MCNYFLILGFHENFVWQLTWFDSTTTTTTSTTTTMTTTIQIYKNCKFAYGQLPRTLRFQYKKF